MGKKLWELLASNRKRLGVLLAATLVLAVPVVAAAVSIKLESGSTTIICEDGQGHSANCPGGDRSPDPGVVTFIGSVDVFTVNVTTAITEPTLGSKSFAILDLSSVDVSGGPGTLIIEASHTGYTGPLVGELYPAVLNVGGTTVGTVSFAGYLDDANNLFGTGTPLGTLGPFFGPGAFSGSITGSASATAPFALTLVANITHNGAGNTGFNFEVRPVAEPGMLSLFGIGLGSVLLGGRRLRHLV